MNKTIEEMTDDGWDILDVAEHMMKLASAWKEAYTMEATASMIVFDMISDMPCDLEDMCPEIDDLLDSAKAALKKAKALDAKTPA